MFLNSTTENKSFWKLICKTGKYLEFLSQRRMTERWPCAQTMWALGWQEQFMKCPSLRKWVNIWLFFSGYRSETKYKDSIVLQYSKKEKM